ncbi:glycosyltransferase [Desertivirga arenae]|uniref:glycosyltransferase n=1 Tax=Desertivirga arenae TaxID=2810309 RepID=UPI001A96B89F|nr:glycosyltransferase [Pedobacter sp. SYSU D00823]
MKKILFFFPLNPISGDSGAKTRVLKLLHYFNRRGFIVDFIGLEYWDDWTEEGILSFKSSGLIRNLFLFNKPPKLRRKNFFERLIKKKFAEEIFEQMNKVDGAFDNLTNLHIKNRFDQVLATHSYNFIIISYAYWADLIKDIPYSDSKTIIDTHDLLTSQVQEQEGIVLGKSLEEEFRRVSQFDEVWAISSDEKFLFSQFIKRKVRLVSLMFDTPEELASQNQLAKYDLIYIASDNLHNQISASWFFENVYPLLNPEIRICVIGGINRFISNYKNVKNILYAESVEPYYREAKVALCPMLSGTGIKVKVVEALSFGLPVVCNSRGIDGLPNKISNGCLVSDDPARFASNIHQLLNNSSLYKSQQEMAIQLFKLAFETSVGEKVLDEAFELT